MYRLLVTLTVKNFEALEKFEGYAAKVMTDYNGSIEQAYETKRNSDGSGEEVHIVCFAKEEDFVSYTKDVRLRDLSPLRDQAIGATDVKLITEQKFY